MDKIDFILSVLKDPEIDESFKSCLSDVYVNNRYCPNFVPKRIVLNDYDEIKHGIIFGAKFQFFQSSYAGWFTVRVMKYGIDYDLFPKYEKIVNKIHLLDKIDSLSK